MTIHIEYTSPSNHSPSRASWNFTERILNTVQDDTRNSGATVPKSSAQTNIFTVNELEDAPKVTFHVCPPPTLAGSPKAESSQISIVTILKRFDFKPVDMKNVISIDPNLKDTPLPLLIETMEGFGKELIRSVRSIQIRAPPSPLLDDIEVIVNEDTDLVPSHILGVTAKAPKTGEHITVTLFPVFDLVFAINCGKVPAFRPSYPVPERQSGEQRVKLPLLTLTVPAPASFGTLTDYLCSKNTRELIRALFPLPPFPMFQDENHIIHFATYLAQAMTSHALLHSVAHVFGFWQNVCAFAISDKGLWTALDLVWQTLLTALAISTGMPQLMIPEVELMEWKKQLEEQQQSA